MHMITNKTATLTDTKTAITEGETCSTIVWFGFAKYALFISSLEFASSTFAVGRSLFPSGMFSFSKSVYFTSVNCKLDPLVRSLSVVRT